ncbi:hypothetical protein Tco_0375428 [Tanacetum coccineum]
MRRGRHSTSFSSAFDQPSSSHLNDDDDDGNDEGTSPFETHQSSILVEEQDAHPIVSTSQDHTSTISLNNADEFNQEDSTDFDGNTESRIDDDDVLGVLSLDSRIKTSVFGIKKIKLVELGIVDSRKVQCEEVLDARGSNPGLNQVFLMSDDRMDSQGGQVGGQGSEVNDGVIRVPDFSTIIAQ